MLEKMKAAFIHAHGEIHQLQYGDLASPLLKPADVLVETQYAGLNHLDIFVVKGWPGLKLPMPHILGSDGAGIVKEVGSEVSLVQPGDRVAINPGISCGKCGFCLAGQQNFCPQFSILGEHRGGTFAEMFAIPESNIFKMPEGFPFEKAAAASLTFLTAWRMLVTQAQLKTGEIVFVHGAGGGVSTAAIQIAKVLGAKVIASTSTPEKMQKTKNIGADHVINYNETAEISKYVFKELTNRQGVDVVIDSVGKPTFGESIRMLKPGGRLVTCGTTVAPIVDLDLRHVFWKQLKILGSTMSTQQEFRDVMRLVFDDIVTPIIDRVFPLSEVFEAEKFLQGASQFGKVLLKI
jgi:NADPH:quinone reductase-like Zn-dependent oxidoreductase